MFHGWVHVLAVFCVTVAVVILATYVAKHVCPFALFCILSYQNKRRTVDNHCFSNCDIDGWCIVLVLGVVVVVDLVTVHCHLICLSLRCVACQYDFLHDQQGGFIFLNACFFVCFGSNITELLPYHPSPLPTKKKNSHPAPSSLPTSVFLPTTGDNWSEDSGVIYPFSLQSFFLQQETTDQKIPDLFKGCS